MTEREERAKRWFAEHKATYQENDLARIITWKTPNKHTYSVVYRWDGSYLMITGDLGVSVFQAHSMSFKFLADSELDYAMSKLVACSYGSGQNKGMIWDPERVRRSIQSAFERAKENFPEEHPDSEFFHQLDALETKLIQACSSSYNETYASISELIPNMRDLGFEPSDLVTMHDGFSPDPCVAAQLDGLKMAIEELERQGVQIQ